MKRLDTETPSHTVRRGRWIVLATLLFVLFFNLFIDQRIGPAGVALFLFGLLVYVLSLTDRSARVRTLVWFGSASTLCTIGSIVINGSGFVQVVSTFAALIQLAVIVYITRVQGFAFDRISQLFLIPWELFIGYMRGIIAGWTFMGKRGNMISSSTTVLRGVVGLVIGLPIAFVLLGLFSSADPIFHSITKNMLSASLVHSITTHMYISCIVFAVLLPVGFIICVKNNRTIADWIMQIPFSAEMSVVSVLVSLVTGAFLVVQWPYVFARVARETDLAQFGVATYSEYVKRGFGELLVITVILYILLWLGVLALQSRNGRKIYLIIVQIILMSEVCIFVISIFRRVWLYQHFHGLTLGRVYGVLFLIWITLLLVILSLRYLCHLGYLKRLRWVVYECAGTLLIFLLFAYGPIENLVVNYDPPSVNNRVDYVYLSDLSPRGVTGWKKAYIYMSDSLKDPSYTSKKILDAGNRQSIGYSGWILQTLTANYLRLVMLYGSDTEQRDTAIRLLTFQKEQLAQFVDLDQTQKDELVFIEKTLSQTIADPLGILRVVWVSNNGSYRSWFGINHTAITHERTGRLSPYFQWNLAQSHAYAVMKSDIQFEELLKLQRLYLSLHKRIESQPENERSISYDISFDGPFSGW